MLLSDGYLFLSVVPLPCSVQQVYDSNETEGQIELSILESGHFLVSQSEELLVSFYIAIILVALFCCVSRISINRVFLRFLIFPHYFFSPYCLFMKKKGKNALQLGNLDPLTVPELDMAYY